MTTDPIIEAAARALLRESYMFFKDEEAQRLASAMLTAVTPLIRAAALEEAAQVAGGYGSLDSWAIATAIRALKSEP